MAETTCLGAALAAGIAKGVEVWNLDDIEPVPSDTFVPSISEDGKIFNLSQILLHFLILHI